MGHHFTALAAHTIIIPATPSDHSSYELVFINTDSGEQVRMTIPRYGMFTDPGREITNDEVEQVAAFVADYLHNFSGSGDEQAEA